MMLVDLVSLPMAVVVVVVEHRLAMLMHQMVHWYRSLDSDLSAHTVYKISEAVRY